MNAKLLLPVVIVLVFAPSAVFAAGSIEQLMEYAKQPILIEETITRQRTVYVPVTKRIRTVERFGLFNRKCRVVYRTVTEMLPETRTSELKTLKSKPSVAGTPGTQFSSKVVSLGAPLSAGAIAERVIKQLKVAFPDKQFPFTADQDGDFPINVNSNKTAADGMRYQVVIDPQSNPNYVDVLIYANATNGGDAQASADSKIIDAEKALIAK